ncbi:MAG: CxxxxCH/CxxCH domain-containing protein [Geobacter sp.]|nr:CxxxxCH/CxxCH domain-containing protein [Geobacter sp.]
MQALFGYVPRFTMIYTVLLLCVAGRAGAIECYQCHGTASSRDIRPLDATERSVSTGGFRGNHRSHVDPGSDAGSCVKCHSDAAAYGPGHRNGQIDLSADINASPVVAVYRNGSTTFPQRANPRLGSCTNVNCHFERETPVWGSPSLAAPSGCSQCHGTPPAGGGSGAAGSHAKHAEIFPGTEGCAVCHDDHLAEVNPFAHATSAGRRPLSLRLPGGSYSGSLDDYLPKSADNQFGSCSGVYCHSDGTNIVTGTLSTGTPVWGAADVCAACHGNPPAYASGSPKANSHQKHPFGCNRCHTATTTNGTAITTKANHRNGSYELSGPAGEAFSYGGVRQCTNSYCHGNGTNVATGAAANGTTTPSWGSGAALSCAACHAFPPAYAKGTPKANAHLLHNSYGYTCSQCHYATTRDGATLADANTAHANRAYDVSGPPGKPVTYTYGATGGSCTAYCHSSVQGKLNPADPPVYASPKWSDSYIRSCRNCHKAGYHAYDSFLMDTGSHFKHLQFDSTSHTCRMCHYTARYGSAGSCYECHNPNTTFIGSNPHYDTSPRGPEHANGVVDVAFHPDFPAAGATGSYSGDTMPGTAYGTCTNLYCHSQGTRATPPYAPANIPTVTWGSGPLPVDCSGCHGGDINASIPMATQSHDRHIGFDCAKCHAGTAYNSRSAIPNKPLSVEYQMYSKGSYHANGNVEVWFLNTTTAINGTYAGQTVTINRVPGTTPGRCTNIYCHSDGTVVVTGAVFTNNSTPLWGTSGRLDCGSCHGNPPAYPDGDPKGNAHQKHSADCKSCHYQTTADNSTINDRKKHAQHRYEVSGAPGITLTYSYAANGSSCSNVSCHSSGGASRDWGTSCIHCHGMPPAYPNYNPKANSHLGSHAALGCQHCHYSVTITGKTISDTSLHNNGKYTIAPGPGVAFTNNTSNTRRCSNVSCHSDGTSVATGAPHSVGISDWGNTALSCYGCHRDMYNLATFDYPNGSPKANSHYAHWYKGMNCRSCHYSVTTDGYSISTPAKHKNGQYDLTAPTWAKPFTYTFASGGGTCASLSCHSDGTYIATGATVTSSATWGGASLGCGSCHGNPPAYANGAPKKNSHTAHADYVCQFCHSSGGSGYTHADGSYSVYPAYSNAPLSYSFSVGGGSCSNTYCHSDGTYAASGVIGSPKTLSWGGSSLNCTSCHGMPPAYADRTPKSNLHAEHAAYGCQVCHAEITTDGVTIANRARHADRFYDVASDGTATFTYTFNTGGSSCASVSCHTTAPANANWSHYANAPVSIYNDPITIPTVSVTVTVVAKFSEDMDPSTLNPETFTLANGATPVSAAVNYDPATRTATLTPTAPLEYGNPHVATLTTGVRNALGGTLSRAYTLNFTTQSSPQRVTLLLATFPGWWISPFGGNGWTGIYPGYNGGTALYNMTDGYVKTTESGTIDNQLISPPLDFTGYQSALVSFSSALSITNVSTVADIDVSVNGSGGPWMNVARATYGNANLSGANFSLLAKGKSNVVLRFRFTSSNSSATGYWGLDNIYIYGDPR